MAAYTITDTTITLYANGEEFIVPRDWMGFDKLKQLLRDGADDEVLAVHAGGYSPTIKSDAITIDSAIIDDIEVTRRDVFYKGQRVNSSLAARLVDVHNEGLPLDPWVKFMANVYANPAEFARSELYDWIEGSNLPITDDGCFLAYKRVRDNGEDATPRYTDIYSGKFDNSPGTVVTMPRQQVDTVRENTCSKGLHFCSADYLKSYGTSWSNADLLVKVNPADVVSIPDDYNFTKGRTWKYEVLQVTPDPQRIEWEDSVIFDPEDDEDFWVDFYEEEEEEGPWFGEPAQPTLPPPTGVPMPPPGAPDTSAAPIKGKSKRRWWGGAV